MRLQDDMVITMVRAPSLFSQKRHLNLGRREIENVFNSPSSINLSNSVLVFVLEVQKNKYSYAKALAKYEQWVQNVSSQTPRIKCKSQDSFMSDYRWETDKVENAPITYGDGGNEEEVSSRIKQGLWRTILLDFASRCCKFVWLLSVNG